MGDIEQVLKGNKNTQCLNLYYITSFYIFPYPPCQKKRNSTLYVMLVNFFRICIFLPRFLYAQLWRQTDHILACTVFLHLEHFTRITVRSKRESNWIIVRYSDVLQTPIFIENRHNLKIFWVTFYWKIYTKCLMPMWEGSVNNNIIIKYIYSARSI